MSDRAAPAPLSAWTPPADLVGVLCDIDDTLTWEGRLVPEALVALSRLSAAGLRVVRFGGVGSRTGADPRGAQCANRARLMRAAGQLSWLPGRGP